MELLQFATNYEPVCTMTMSIVSNVAVWALADENNTSSTSSKNLSRSILELFLPSELSGLDRRRDLQMQCQSMAASAGQPCLTSDGPD